MSSRPYRALGIKQVAVEGLVQGLAGQGASVGLDVHKDWLVAVWRWSDGRFERPWRVANPGEIRELVDRLETVCQARATPVGLESSGTYGEPVRQALTDAGIAVERVSGKAVHDYAEIFDGVPSQHDGKSAAVIGELVALGKSSPWPYRSRSPEWEAMALAVDQMDGQLKIETVWTNRVEGWLGRHWPETKDLLRPSSSTLLRTLGAYGGPCGVASAGPEALARIRRWGGHFLTREKARALMTSASETVGVRCDAASADRVRLYAREALSARAKRYRSASRLRGLARSHEAIERQGQAVGVTTAGVLWVDLGSPSHYASAGAYRKAMGLNLREYSSGRHQGELKISRRGPSRVRRWLYLASVRLVKSAPIRSWFAAKKASNGGQGGQAMVALMRRLAVALWHVGVDQAVFDPGLLFARPST